MKKLSKIIALVLALAMVFCLAACGSLDDTTAEDTTGEVGKTPIAKSDIKIGVLHITSKEDTSGYTFAHQSGIEEMISNLGLSEGQVIIKDEISDTDVAATTKSLQELVDADCDLIFATSYNYMDTVEQFAERYPDIIFSHCSGYKSNGVNMNNYFGRIYQARYLSGIAAGMKAKELNKPLIGYVAAMDSTNSEVTGGINAFALGVQSVYPEAQVKVRVTGSWYDPAAEGAAATALIEAGCAVISQHCDSDTPQTIAQNAGVFGCGYNSDMTASAPKAHICAPIWSWGAYYTQAADSVIKGQWTGENYFGGIADGLVDVSPINEAVAAPGTKEAIDEAKTKMISGELVVFAAGLTDNAGNAIVGQGENGALSDEQIKVGINYYIQGVSLL